MLDSNGKKEHHTCTSHALHWTHSRLFFSAPDLIAMNIGIDDARLRSHDLNGLLLSHISREQMSAADGGINWTTVTPAAAATAATGQRTCTKCTQRKEDRGKE